MKRKFRFKPLVFIGLGICLVAAALSYAMHCLNTIEDKKFRTMQDKIVTQEKVDLRGLRELPASGGAAIYFSTLGKRLANKGKKIVIVDIREVDEGYVKGRPAYYFGYQYLTPGAPSDLKPIRSLFRRLVLTGSWKKRPELVVPEKEMAQQYGYGYQRLVVNSGGPTPPADIDAFVSFIDHLPDDVWLHFHCFHGSGRTSSALVMFDIMRNAPTVSLQDIVKRHLLLGSVDLFDLRKWKKSSYTFEQLKFRKEFIEQFYDFICQRKAGGIQLWSEWLPHQTPPVQ